MNAAARRVRHLRLAAPDAGAARRGTLLIEDALRTATIPEATAGRVLVVRRLDLGRIALRAAPATVALEVERRLRALSRDAVYFERADAARAQVVWFRDPLEPLCALAVRVACGAPTGAWFWPLAVRGFRPGAPRDTTLRTLLREASATEVPALAVARLVHELLEADAVDPLMEALGPADGPTLLRACGWSVAPAPRALPEKPRTAARRAAQLRRWAARLGPEEPRAVWLVAAALAGERPHLAAAPDLPAMARAEARVLADAHRGAEAARPHAAPRRSPSHAGDRTSPGVALPGADSAARETAEPPPRPRAATAPPAPSTPAMEPPAREAVAAGPARARGDRPAPTHHGGLYFLLPVLRHLGIEAALAANPAWRVYDLVQRILDRAADRTGAPPDDPVRPDDLAPSDPAWTCPFRAPERWWPALPRPDGWRLSARRGDPDARVLTDAGGMPWALWRGAPPPDLPPSAPSPEPTEGSDLDLLVRSWLDAAERWLTRADPTLGLADVVRRPAGVLRTRTHLDLLFDLDHADLRLRRLALDVNPGWVPWFGRVVTFHYLVGGRRACD